MIVLYHLHLHLAKHTHKTNALVDSFSYRFMIVLYHVHLHLANHTHKTNALIDSFSYRFMIVLYDLHLHLANHTHKTNALTTVLVTGLRLFCTTFTFTWPITRTKQTH